MAASNPPFVRDTPVTGLLLAGGRGRRMGGVDKGLQPFEGKPLARWVIEVLAPQVDELLVNANRSRSEYEAFGYRVIGDRIADFAGPLAGLHAGLAEAAHELVACAPCDTPLLPADFVARLVEPLRDDSIDVAYASAGGHSHPVVCVARRRLLPRLETFLREGGRKVEDWFATLSSERIEFGDEGAFRNVNTADELR